MDLSIVFLPIVQVDGFMEVHYSQYCVWSVKQLYKDEVPLKQ